VLCCFYFHSNTPTTSRGIPLDEKLLRCESMKIKEVVDLAGISVRTLHHYDEINLLKPDSLSEAGYRLYSEENIETLQQILFFKSLGLPLKQIQDIITSPTCMSTMNGSRKISISSAKVLLFSCATPCLRTRIGINKHPKQAHGNP
jgi:DNA-binding transcriptional MerR regulator